MRSRISIALACATALAGCTSDPKPIVPEDGACPAPLKTLPSGTCLAAPMAPRPDAPVVVFLHPMTESLDWAIDELTRRLVVEATEMGLVVLLPQGRQGLCDWSDEVAHFWCWPIADRHREELQALAARLREDVADTRRLLRLDPSRRPFLAGFSNGGFASVRLAAHSDLELAGLAVFHGGASFPEPLPESRALPTLLRAATEDEWHFPTMIDLRSRMVVSAWPAIWQQREGGHDLEASDIEALLAFVAGGADAAAERP